jgi:KDO2-lipid IV(A) lauroyltransferase
VVTNLFRFVCDVAEGGRLEPAVLRSRIRSVEGRAHYDAARRLGKGAVIATAHLGSFEVGMASLSEIEPRMHVVFKRDRLSRFDRLRSRLHERVGAVEAPIDDGWESWMRLRDALLADEVVFVQADRAMPRQRAVAVPFCGGHIRLPLGPVKLAQMTGSPIIPVFAPWQGRGVRICVEPAITADGNPREALHRLAAAIEKHVCAAPEQWLAVYRAWVEDDPAPSERGEVNDPR